MIHGPWIPGDGENEHHDTDNSFLTRPLGQERLDLGRGEFKNAAFEICKKCQGTFHHAAK